MCENEKSWKFIKLIENNGIIRELKDEISIIFPILRIQSKFLCKCFCGSYISFQKMKKTNFLWPKEGNISYIEGNKRKQIVMKSLGL